MNKSILLSNHGGIAIITFNRPEAMNTFNPQLADELIAATQQVATDTTMRAVILNGAGKMFMAGGDIHYFHESLSAMPKGVRAMVNLLHSSVTTLMTMPKPVLASVHGSVAGAGASLMMACDLVISAQQTKFSMAYSGIGVSPDGGATFNLPRLVGTKKAMEWLLFSDAFDAEQAKAHGLINWVVPEEILQEKTMQIANHLAKGPSEAYARIKKLVNSAWNNNLETQLAHECDAFEYCTATNDFKAGVSGFISKKKPVFEGR